jgi:nicotinamide-nucleotide amidase
VTIGTELLLGHQVDTNAAHIARALSEHGIDVFAHHSVGDNVERCAVMLNDVLDRAGGAIATGGLGPTVDDVTREAVARVVGTELEMHEPSLRAMEERFTRLGRVMSENNRRQALIPRGGIVLENPHGTAPGFIAFRADGGFVACMPGVPAEMKPMLAERLLPWLVERCGARGAIYTRTLHTAGVSESELDRRIETLFRSSENPKIAMLAHRDRVDVKIMAKAEDSTQAQALIAPLEAQLRERIGADVYGVDGETLASVLVRSFTERGLTVGVAESLTGGGIADALVSVPGASACFRGGITAYDNTVKTSLLGVEEAILREQGAVSAETAAAMARGARERLGVDFAVAATGVAGPTGATPGKPVGLVWFGLAFPNGAVDTQCMRFPGERGDVRQRAITHALRLLRQALAEQGSTAFSQDTAIS